jgi:hypothetical protein
VNTDRTFLREGHCQLIKGESRYLYLFNDLLLVTKIKTYKQNTLKVELPMETVAAADIPDSECMSLLRISLSLSLSLSLSRSRSRFLSLSLSLCQSDNNICLLVIQNCVELVRMDKQQRYQFIFPTPEEKQEWLTDFDVVHAKFHKGDSEALERKPMYRPLETASEEGSASPEVATLQRRDTMTALKGAPSAANITREKKKLLKGIQGVCIRVEASSVHVHNRLTSNSIFYCM